jgi:tetratricopeptide (TPR) repeat protein
VALHLARQAIETGREDPDALWMAAFTLSHLAGEHAVAAGVLGRALALNPNSALAWGTSGWVSSYQSQPGPAIEAFQRAMRLSPLDPLGWTFSGGLAHAHAVAGRYEAAMEWIDPFRLINCSRPRCRGVATRGGHSRRRHITRPAIASPAGPLRSSPHRLPHFR